MEIERKLLFDKVVAAYATARPGYPKELLQDIESICGLQEHSQVLEIGCGTGQASELLLKAGFRLTAIEIGFNMSDYVRRRFLGNPDFEVINLPFEEYNTTNLYNLVISASAFHWIDPSIGYAKAHSLLKPGGYLVLVWNGKDESSMQSDLWQEIDRLYSELMPPKDNNIHKHEERLKQIVESGYFEEPVQRSYPYELKMSADEYIKLLGTYSDHIALEDSRRDKLFSSVKSIIGKYGDNVTVPYSVKAYFALRKATI